MPKSFQRFLVRSGLFALILFVIFLSIGIGAIAYNNRDVEIPSDKELSDSLEASIVWLVENRESILDVNNAILWYFLHRAAQVSSDPRIQSLVDTYYSTYINPIKNSFNRPQHIWSGMFNPEHKVKNIPFEVIGSWAPYVQFYAYAINCDEELGQLDIIRAQNSPEFCGSAHFLQPTCVTHQLVGIRFLQRSGCGDQEQLLSTVETLQAKIVNELVYDPRVVDIYMHRILMLVESNNPGAVKNIWLRRLLDHQHSDGGWGNFQPLVCLDDDKQLYLSYSQIWCFRKIHLSDVLVEFACC